MNTKLFFYLSVALVVVMFAMHETTFFAAVNASATTKLHSKKKENRKMRMTLSKAHAILQANNDPIQMEVARNRIKHFEDVQRTQRRLRSERKQFIWQMNKYKKEHDAQRRAKRHAARFKKGA